jgi:hypothetical protein
MTLTKLISGVPFPKVLHVKDSLYILLGNNELLLFTTVDIAFKHRSFAQSALAISVTLLHSYSQAFQNIQNANHGSLRFD